MMPQGTHSVVSGARSRLLFTGDIQLPAVTPGTVLGTFGVMWRYEYELNSLQQLPPTIVMRLSYSDKVIHL